MPGEPSAQQLQKQEHIQKLHEAVDLSVIDICSNIGSEIGVTFSPEVIANITKLAIEKTERTAEDLEAFASHAKRTTIVSDDVKLLTRRNPNLNAHLSSLIPAKTTNKPVKVTKSVKNKDATSAKASSASSSKGKASAPRFEPLID